MKTKSPFDTLSETDRAAIFDLCETHPYRRVLELIARPRAEGGFELQTTYSSLRRFYIKFNKTSEQNQTLFQYAESLQLNRQDANGAFCAAILSLVESHILQALKKGTSPGDLQKEFQILTRLQRTFISMEKFRDTSLATQELGRFQTLSAIEEAEESGEPIETPVYSILPGPSPSPKEVMSMTIDRATDIILKSGDRQALMEAVNDPAQVHAIARRVMDRNPWL